MTALLTLRLPLSTDFGNAKSSTRGLPCTTPVTSARRAPKMRILLSSRRTSPLVFDRTQNNQALHVDMPAGGGPQFRDQPQDVGKQIAGDGDLGHLVGHPECDVAAMADGLRADLDAFFLQAR